MWDGSCPAEKMTPDPLLGSQKTQVKQNGTTHVIIPLEGGKSRKAGRAGLLSRLKSWARHWAVPSVVLNLLLLIIMLIIPIAQSAKKSEPGPADLACPEGWVGYLGKCYYFSEVEANWTSSQRNCSALNASLAGIDTQKEMDFMMRYWTGLHREPGQPWKWTNDTEFNNWFTVVGGEKCAFMNHNDIASSSCYREGRWICSKPVEKRM